MGVLTTLSIPPQDVAITVRHTACWVQAHQAYLQRKISNLMDQQVVIQAAIITNPLDRAVLREKMEVEYELSKCTI